MNQFEIYHYDQMDKDLLYEILRLRMEVFVVEQEIVYQDMDQQDQDALHVLLRHEGNILAYARIIQPQEDQIRFGRVLTAPNFRGCGHGKELMERLMAWLHQHHPNKTLTIRAQSYLENFYQAYGLETQGEPYILEGISHLNMIKQL